MPTIRCGTGVIALLALIAGEAVAQARIGLQLGGNRATIAWENENFDVEGLARKPRNGFQGGLVAAIGTGTVSVMPGLLLTQKGVRFEYDLSSAGLDVEGDVAMKLTYAQVPLLVLVRPGAGSGGETAPFLYAGPAFGRSVSCTVSSTASGFGESASESEDCEDLGDLRNKNDLSLIAGAGIAVGSAYLALQYDHGLSDLSKGDPSGPARNRTFSFVLRYFLGR